MIQNTSPIKELSISTTERNAIEYATKSGLLKMLFNAELISEQHYCNALNALRAEAVVVAA